jgi:hypothetical protein
MSAARIVAARSGVKTPVLSMSVMEVTPPLEPRLPSSMVRKLTHQVGAGVGAAGFGHRGEDAFDDVGADLCVPVGVHDGDVDVYDVLAGVGGQDAADGDHVGGAFDEVDLEADAGEFDELADLRDQDRVGERPRESAALLQAEASGRGVHSDHCHCSAPFCVLVSARRR